MLAAQRRRLRGRPREAGESVVVPAAPGLTWASADTDTTPDFQIDLPSGNVDTTLNAQAGDKLILEYQLQAGGAWTQYLSYTLLSGDITDDLITKSGVTPVSNGSYFFRGRLERGALIGTNSSNASVTISASPPVNSVAPVISGNQQVGQTLSTTNGTWSGSPTGFTYQWKRDGVDISGATANTRVLAELDAGADITCAVTASNGAGSGTPAASNTLAIDVYLVFLAHIEDATDAGTYSGGVWNNVPLGAAATNRKIIVAPAARNSAGLGGTISAASVASQPLSQQIVGFSDTQNNKAAILAADVTTGTSGNISIAFTQQQNRCGAGVWAMYGAGSSTASDTDSTLAAADGNVTLTVPAGGVAVSASYHQATGTVTYTNLTGRYDAVVEGGIEHCGGDTSSHAGGNINMISDWSAADTNGIHVFASWGP